MSNGISAELQAILDAGSRQTQQNLEIMQQLANDNIKQNKLLFLKEAAQMSLSRSSIDTFKRAGNELLKIQSLTNRAREEALGAPAAPVTLGNDWGTVAQDVRDNAPKIDRSDLDPLVTVRNDADFWNDVVRRLDAGVSIEDLPETINGRNVAEALAEHGIDKNNPQDGDVDRINQLAENTNRRTDAIEACRGEEVTDEDVANMIEALGDRTESFRTDSDAFMTAHQNRKMMQTIAQKVSAWRQAYNIWLYRTSDDSASEELHEPILAGYLTAEERAFLESEFGIDVSTASYEDITDALEVINEHYNDALNTLINRSSDPVSPDDVEADTMSEASAMATASSMLSEEEEDLDIGPLP
jgi:hypothetical protein